MVDPRVVDKYLAHLYISMRDNDLFNKMDELHQQAVHPLTPRLIQEYEELDVKVCKMMQDAEAQCRKLKTGTIPWSPAYQHASLLLEYWLKRRSYFLKEHTNVRELIVLQN